MVAPRADRRSGQGIERQGVNMGKISSGTRSIRTNLLVLGLGLAGLVSAGQAIAGCAGFSVPPSAPALREAPASNGFLKTVYRPGQARIINVSDDQGTGIGGVVGTWRFKFVSDGTAYPAPIPVGATVDFGTQQWHGDGTEIMISGGRAPSSGDVCMGVWEKTGPRTFRLKHIALAYVSSDTPPPVGPVAPAAFVGPAIIRETVMLSPSGDSFQGRFTLDQYAADEVTLLEHIAGTVTGTRFTVD
jgi:hypothetical protein